MVEYIEFREFAGSLQSLFKFVSKNTLKSDILKIYDNEREKVLKMMDKNESRIVITIDMWTSSTKRESSWSLLLTLSITLGRYKAGF